MSLKSFPCSIIWVGDPADRAWQSLARAVADELGPRPHTPAVPDFDAAIALAAGLPEGSPAAAVVVSPRFPRAPAQARLRALWAQAPLARVVLCRRARRRRGQDDPRLTRLDLPEDPRASQQLLRLALNGALMGRGVDLLSRALEGREARIQVLEGQLLGAQDSLSALDPLRWVRRAGDDAALVDPVTGLPNRLALIRRLEHELRLCHRHQNHRFLMYPMDLHRFPVINGSLGSQRGDALLAEIGRRLRRLMRREDLVARVGGDAFAVVATGVESESEARALAHRLLDEVTFSTRVDGRPIRLDAGLGAVIGTDRYAHTDEILRDAELALSRVDGMGRAGPVLFDPHSHLADRLCVDLEADLLGSLERGEFRLQYQPMIHASSGCIAGYEGLLRWWHHRYGEVSPALFIPVAERSRVILSLGAWVMDRGLSEFRAMVDASDDPELFLALNVSRHELLEPGYAGRVCELLRRYEVDPSRLMLEVTESAAVEGDEVMHATLTELRRAGVRILLDDFGVGQSSLHALRGMPIDGLKVDRAFVAGTDTRQGAAMLSAVVSLGRSLGMAIVAEGIETRAELDAVTAVQCDFAQGFYFSRALDPETAVEQLRRDALLIHPKLAS